MRSLLIGGARSATGYGRVLRQIGHALAPLGPIDCIQVGPDDGLSAPGALLHNPHRFDFGARRFIAQAAVERDPDVALVVHDLEYCAEVARLIARAGARCAVITYCPLEGPLAPTAPVTALDTAAAVVLYTPGDAAAVARRFDQRAGRSPGTITAIPHGIERSSFVPLGDADGARRRLFGDAFAAETSFLVLNANRPVGRKRLDTTLRLFARFAAGKPPSVRLLLKAVGPASRPADLGDQVQALGLAGRVHWTDALGLPHPLPDTALNLLYNACEVGLNTSQGEGWGLVAYEHAAAGAAQIVPHHASAEAWRGYPGLIPTSARAPADGSSFGCVDIEEERALQVLERLYADPAFRAEAGRQARQIATRPEFDWSVIGAAWRQLVRSVLAYRTRD